MGIKEIADALHKKGYTVSQSALLRLDDLGRDKDEELVEEFIEYLESRRKNIADIDVINFEHFRTTPRLPRNQRRLQELKILKREDVPDETWTEKEIKNWIKKKNIPIKYNIKRQTKKEILSKLRKYL